MNIRTIIARIRPDIKRALREDCPRGDITSDACVDKSGRTAAELVAKSGLTLSGLEIFREVMKSADAGTKVVFKKRDGQRVKRGEIVARLSGKSRSILLAERTALNYLQRMCGIATLTAKFSQKLKGTKVKLLDTRKTTPNMRLLEKYAVRCGGGHSHRTDLSDMPLVKENHITAAGGITEAVRKLRRVTKKRIIVEVENKKELMEGLEAGADILLLDNMTPAAVAKMVKIAGRRAEVEVSGGVNLKNIRRYALAGADRISVGSLTHSAPVADLSLLFI